MGFFAVVRDSPDEPPFKVLECHLNLWSLGGLGRRVFKFDVGLRLQGSDDFSEFRLAVPFGTSRYKNLARATRNNEIAELLFGGPAPAPVAVSYTAQVEPAMSGKDYTLWRVELPNRVKRQEEVYVRIRFDVDNKGREWIWKRWLWGAYGAIVDLRVADVREAVGVPNWEGLKERIVPIERLNLFVMAPSSLQAAAMSPTPRYIRVLEGKAWVPYIGRAPDLFRTGKLIVYSWRSDEHAQECIDTHTPFRVFLDLNRASVLANPLVAGAFATLTVFLGSLMAINIGDITRSTHVAWGAVAAVLAVGSIGLLSLVLRFVSGLRRIAQRAFFWFENLVYGSQE